MVARRAIITTALQTGICRRIEVVCYDASAGWSSLVARRAHNPKVVSSNLTPATILRSIGRTQASGLFLFVGLRARKIRAVSS